MRLALKGNRCRVKTCPEAQPSLRGRFRRKKQPGYRFDGGWYCGEACLGVGLSTAIQTLRAGGSRGVPADRGLRPTLGLLLMEQGNLSREELSKALEAQRRQPGSRIGELLRYLGLVSERDITQALSRQFRIPWVNFVKGRVSDDAIRLVPAVVARHYRAVPVDYRRGEGQLLLAIAGPPDYAFLNGLSRVLDLQVTILVADESQIQALLDRFYPEHQVRERVLQLQSLERKAAAGFIASLASASEADSLQLERCGARLWLRLLRAHRCRDYLVEVDLPGENEAYVS